MNRFGRTLTVVGFALVVAAGCATEKHEATHAAKAERAAAMSPPANSKLAKVTPGMSTDEVEKILGRPDDKREHETGKRWVPWYFGPDVRRVEWYYKGLGRVSITGGNQFGGGGGKVHHVEYDPGEDGRGGK